MSQLAELDRAEIERCAAETAQITVNPSIRGRVLCSLNPPSDALFPPEYAFSQLGDVRHIAILDFGSGLPETSSHWSSRALRDGQNTSFLQCVGAKKPHGNQTPSGETEEL